MASLLPSGPLSTSGSQIVDAAGNPVRIASVGWQMDFGLDDMWKTKEAGFNTIRVSWTNHLIDEDIQRIKTIVANAKTVGIKVIMVNHANSSLTPQQQNGLWYDLGGASDGTDGQGNRGTTTDAKFLSDWVRMAREFVGNDTVIGYDIRNEPLGYYWDGMSSWEAGSNNPDQNIRWMYERVGKAIQAVDPDKLMIFEGPQRYDGNYAGTGKAPWGDLSLAGQMPVVLTVPNKVVYSVHDYPAYIGGFRPVDGAERIDWMNRSWGYLVRDDIAPVWIGEMGANFTGVWGGEDPDESRRWAQNLIDYMNGKMGAQGGPTFSGNEQPVPGNWWVWGNFSGGDLQGTLNDNGTFRAEQKAFWDQLLYTPGTGGGVVNPPPPPPPVTPSDDDVIQAGDGQTITDDAGHVWTINASGQVTQDGQLAGYSRGVITLAKVGGTIWQENDAHLWWAWDGSGWGEGAGTSQSPIGSGGGPVDPPPPPPPTGSGEPGQWTTATLNGMEYNVLLPENYDPNVAYPVVLFLHQLANAVNMPGQPDVWFNDPAFRAAHPAIVVVPELDQSADWSGETVNWGGVSPNVTDGENKAIAVLKKVLADHKHDPGRIYVTGDSMGGIGTWEMMIDYNAQTGQLGKIFAAGLPLAGADYEHGYPNPDPAIIDALRNVPIWAIHGAQDGQVPLEWDRAMAAALAGSPTFKYTEDPNLGHDVWDDWYAKPEVWSWLFAQRSGAAPPPAEPPVDPNAIGSGSDTIVINLSSDPDGPVGNAGRWAQFTLNVDGKQIGGVHTVDADRSLGQNRQFTFKGNFGPGAHKVTVTFANNSMTQGDKAAFNTGGDRNLYVERLTYNGAVVSSTSTGIYESPWYPPEAPDGLHPGNAVFTVNDTTAVPAGAPSTPTTTPADVSFGTGPDRLTLRMAEDPFEGDAQFTVKVDGIQVGGVFTTKAVQWQGQEQLFHLNGDWAPGAHEVTVAFTNDHATLNQQGLGLDHMDRNLYVIGASLNGGTATGTPWELPQNGSKVFQVTDGGSQPPPPSSIPAAAASVGYTTQTFGPDIDLGTNWFPMSFYGLDPGSMNIEQNTDGSVTLAGPWSFNAQISTAKMGGDSLGWSGIAFGGGAYIEATLSWENPYNGYGYPQSTGWPAFWANDIEGMSGLYNTSWPGQSFPRNIEVDFMEYWSDTNWGGALHDWWGPNDLVKGTETTLPNGASAHDPHKYGFLWVPATETTKGRAEWYFDGIHLSALDLSWDMYDPAKPPPPEIGSTAWSQLDTRHLALLLGTGAGNPMTVYDVEVWQASSANNMSTLTPPPPPPPPPAGGGSPNNTVIVAGDGKTITDAAGAVWTIDASKLVTKDGALAGYSRGVEKLAYVDGVVWQQNDQNLWWSWNGTTWGTHAGYAQSPVPVTPPPPAVVPEIEVLSGGVTATVDPTKAGNIVVGGNMIDVMTPGVVGVIGGSQPTAITFLGLSSTIFVGQDGPTTATADKGSNLWVVGRGAMTITAGADADAFFINKGDGLLTINAFDVAEDKLVVASDMKSSMVLSDNGAGGTLLTFGEHAGGIDVKNTTLTTDKVMWQ